MPGEFTAPVTKYVVGAMTLTCAIPPPAPAATPAAPGVHPLASNPSFMPSFAYINIAPFVALSTIFACVPRQKALGPPSR